MYGLKKWSRLKGIGCFCIACVLFMLMIAADVYGAKQDDIWEMVQEQEGLEKAIAEGLVTFDSERDKIAPISAGKVGTRADIVRIAKNQVGISGRPNKFTRWYGPISGYPDNGYSYAWCQVFASWCGVQAGVDVPITASCYYGYVGFRNRGLWRSRTSGYTPQAGDYIYFDWSANGGWDHVGIVNYVKNGRVYTIEGNTGDMVKASKSYSLTDVEIIGYGTPKYSGKGAQNNLPMGCFDEVLPEKGTNRVRVRGWSFDWDAPEKALSVVVCVGGTYESAAIRYVVKANTYRPDVNAAYPGAGDYHGFDKTLEVSVDRTTDKTIYVYAVNVEGSGSKKLIGSRILKADKSISGNDSQESADIKAVSNPRMKAEAYNKLKVSWKTVKRASGYQIQVAKDKKFKKSVTVYESRKTEKAFKASCGVAYYCRVRAFCTIEGRTYYGKYSSVVSGKAKVAKPSWKSCKSTSKGRITIKYGKVAGANGYQITIARNKKFTKGKKSCGTKSTGKTITSLKRGKWYYVKVRAYRIVKGKKVYGSYGSVKRIKVQ